MSYYKSMKFTQKKNNYSKSLNDIYNKLNPKVNLFTLKVMSLRMELKLLCFYYEKKTKIKRGGEHLAVYFLFNFWKTTNSGNKFFFFLNKEQVF